MLGISAVASTDEDIGLLEASRLWQTVLPISPLLAPLEHLELRGAYPSFFFSPPLSFFYALLNQSIKSRESDLQGQLHPANHQTVQADHEEDLGTVWLLESRNHLIMLLACQVAAR